MHRGGATRNPGEEDWGTRAALWQRWFLRGTPVWRYLLAVGATLLAYGLRQLIVQGVGETPPFVTFYPAIMLVALFLGLGPGILTTILAGLLLIHDVFPRENLLQATSWADDVALGVFASMGVLMSVVADLYRRARVREVNYQEQLALREYEDRLRFALDASQTGDWDMDLIDHTTHHSPLQDQIFGYDTPPADWSFERFLEHVLPEDRPAIEQRVRQIVEGGSDISMEYRIRRVDGEVRWLLSTGRRRDLPGKHPRLAGTVQDITDRKRAEEELRLARDAADQAKALAELSNRAKDYFLAVLSHELRTPLTPALLGLEMLKNQPDQLPAQQELLETIHRHVELEAQLIDDLLDVTRIANGKLELQRQPVQICQVLQRAVEVCRPDLQARGLQFAVDLGSHGPYWIEADAARLQQVFWNLLKNAIKFTPHGGCVGLRAALDGDNHLVVEVCDSGIGIAADVLPRLFSAFTQAERAITRQFGGLGLGLAISKALVELHGGTIEAYSAGKDQGSTFRVRLPLIAAAQCPETAPASREPAGVLRPLRILLVEDHGMTAKILRQLLSAEGHAIEAAGDVASGLALAMEDRFDLLISDLGLPDASGYDLLRELRRRGQQVPAIAMSGYGQESDIQRSHEAGFAAHLTKPASREALLATIATLTTTPAPA